MCAVFAAMTVMPATGIAVEDAVTDIGTTDGGKAPTFLVDALMDPIGANFDW